MPHDLNGKLVEEGEVVLVRCVVLRVHEGDDYCNVDLKTIHCMPPYSEGTRLVLNTKQVEKA